MPKIPRISGREAIKAFERIGYQKVRQRGSHIRLIHADVKEHAPLTIPEHSELGVGLVRKLLRDSKITIDNFIKLLKSK